MAVSSSPSFPRKVPLLRAAACAFVATVLAGCASSGPLVAAAPQGVDLSGQWRLNENLSDDPQHLDEPKEAPPKLNAPSRNPGGFGRPGTTMPGMPGGPGGIDPGGGNDNLTSTSAAPGFVPVRYGQSTGLPPSASDSPPPAPGGKPAPGEGTVSRMLDAPQLLTISQVGSKLIVRSGTDATTYTAGEQRTIPFGKTEADRTAGWRDAAFVVITKAKKGPSKEDDFALDAEGHLIFATLVTHVKKGPIDFKRVYDRVRAPN
ncbi:MAG TPA: hypothetical protein VHB68_19485 [Steroidobacteraceae bacterium]|nr:hypothetical protein [Steroidobacteraceae bacterium]